MNKILPIILVVVLSGCASRISDIRIETYDKIPVDKDVIAMIGDTMVMHGHLEVGSGLKIKGNVDVPPTIFTMGIRTRQKSAFLFMQNEEDRCYGPFQMERIDPLLGSLGTYFNDGFCVPSKGSNGDKKLYWIMSNGSPINRVKIDNDYDVITNMKRFSDDDSFIQEFIYNGRVDNSIKFIYREFTESLARPSFQQEIQYDLDQSNIIGFKEMKIKIIQATNQQIEYRILKNFTPKRFE